MKPKIIRASTISMSMIFLTGMLEEIKRRYEVVLLSSPGPELDEVEKEYGVKGIRIPIWLDDKSAGTCTYLYRTCVPDVDWPEAEDLDADR